MSLPTVILCEPECLTLRIAGLLVIDRLVVAAHRAEVADEQQLLGVAAVSAR